MNAKHEFSGTRHRLTLNGKAGPWAPIHQPAVLRDGPSRCYATVVQHYGTTPAMPEGARLYVIEDIGPVETPPKPIEGR